MALAAEPRSPLPLAVSGQALRDASDARLVALVRAGSQSAFEEVFERHQRPLLSFCTHMLGGQAEAEDVVQHTFLAAYRDLVGSDKAIALRPWLFAIARNRCLSVLRARRERPADDLEREAEPLGVAAQVQEREDLRELLGDLHRLPDDQRAALVLFELDDLTHEQIAQVLGCRKDKVKALVFQAREALAGARAARGVSCLDIREELSTARGAALRRGPLRRHLAVCAGCRAFRDEVARQRKGLAILLPVVPSAMLKAGALPWTAGGAGAAAAGTVGASVGGGAVVAGTAAGGGAVATAGLASGGAAVAGTGGVAGIGAATIAKIAVVTALAAGGTVGVTAVATQHRGHGPASSPAASTAPPARPGAGAGLGPVSVPAAPGAAAAIFVAPGRAVAARPSSAAGARRSAAARRRPKASAGRGQARSPAQAQGKVVPGAASPGHGKATSSTGNGGGASRKPATGSAPARAPAASPGKGTGAGSTGPGRAGGGSSGKATGQGAAPAPPKQGGQRAAGEEKGNADPAAKAGKPDKAAATP